MSQPEVIVAAEQVSKYDDMIAETIELHRNDEVKVIEIDPDSLAQLRGEAPRVLVLLGRVSEDARREVIEPMKQVQYTTVVEA